jgi:hypothetical protein
MKTIDLDNDPHFLYDVEHSMEFGRVHALGKGWIGSMSLNGFMDDFRMENLIQERRLTLHFISSHHGLTTARILCNISASSILSSDPGRQGYSQLYPPRRVTR